MTERKYTGMTRGQAKKLERLLHMKYKPSEVSREIGITTDMIYRTYLPAGAPCERDSKNNVWIVGDVFADWVFDYVATNKRKTKIALEKDQFYCVSCNKAVRPPEIKKSKATARGGVILTGKCSECGKKINRFGRASEWGAK